MKCPECGAETEVFDSRPGGCAGTVHVKPQLVYRRRRCVACGHRFTTHEKPVGEWEGADIEPTNPLERLSHELDVVLMRYEKASRDEARTLGRAVILLEQVTTAVARAYRDSAASETAPKKPRSRVGGAT